MGRVPTYEEPMKTLGLRVTAAQKKKFERAAKKAGKPVSTWVRDELIKLIEVKK